MPLLLVCWLQAAASTPRVLSSGFAELRSSGRARELSGGGGTHEARLEQYLTEELGVSRATVGAKVEQLADEGYDTPELVRTLSPDQLQSDFGIASASSKKKVSVLPTDADEDATAALQLYLTEEVGINRRVVGQYVERLAEEGYDTPVLFATLSPENLVSDFRFKKGHAKLVQIFRDATVSSSAGAATTASKDGGDARAKDLRTIADMAQFLADEERSSSSPNARERRNYLRRNYFRKHTVDELLNLPVMAARPQATRRCL